MSRERGGEYARFDVTLPKDAVDDAGWTAGMELEWDVEGRAIVLRPASKKKS